MGLKCLQPRAAFKGQREGLPALLSDPAEAHSVRLGRSRGPRRVRAEPAPFPPACAAAVVGSEPPGRLSRLCPATLGLSSSRKPFPAAPAAAPHPCLAPCGHSTPQTAGKRSCPEVFSPCFSDSGLSPERTDVHWTCSGSFKNTCWTEHFTKPWNFHLEIICSAPSFSRLGKKLEKRFCLQWAVGSGPRTRPERTCPPPGHHLPALSPGPRKARTSHWK